MDISICVIGAGKWGTNHINTLSALGVEVGIVEKDRGKKTKLNIQFPEISCFDSLKDAIQKNFDGYIIATPPITHFDIAKRILLINKPVLVEIPFTLSTKDCNEFLSIVENTSGKLIVGHLLLFHPAIIKMKELIVDGVLGNMLQHLI